MTALTKMNVDKLLTLRKNVTAELAKRHKQIQKQMEMLNGDINGRSRDRSTNQLKGTKVKPKYKGPNGETWAGRGMKPKWLTALVKQGRKMESYRVKET